MSTFEFKNEIYNLSLDLGDRFNLALFKKIWGQNVGHVKQDRSVAQNNSSDLSDVHAHIVS